jgi:hypothetical protein
MYRRWRQELAIHTSGYSWHSLAPPDCAIDVDCHCARGVGTMRKNRPLGCPNPRCYMCKGEKLLAPKGRADRRAAIAYDCAANDYCL